MEENQHSSRDGAQAGQRLDLLLALLLFVAALGVRWLYVQAVEFPPLDDPAFYLTTARNLLTGRGLEVDVLWSYQIPFSSVTHASHEHWMPMTTGLIAAAYALQRAVVGVLPTPLPTGQMPGLIIGALLAPLTYLIGRRMLPRGTGVPPSSSKHGRWIPLGAALLVVANATLSYQSASADSSAPFALLAAWALSMAVRNPGDQGGYFGAGLLVALAYLTRADGILLLLTIPLAWYLLPLPPRRRMELPDSPAAEIAWQYWPRERKVDREQPRALGPSVFNVLDLAVSFALVVTPWLVRNYLAFGTPLPSSVLSQAWLTDYLDTFNYWSHPTSQTWLAQGWQVLLDQRVQALLHNGRVFLLTTFPWGLLALPGLWLLRREWSFFPSLVYGLFLFFGVAIIFPVSSMTGTFYHSLGAVMPFLALAAVYAVYRASQPFRRFRKLADAFAAIAVIALLVLTVAQWVQALPTVAERHQAEKRQFQAAAAWLAQNAAPGDVVMTTQTYTLNYTTGHPTIVLPGNEPPDAAWEAAQRYGGRYLVITQPFGLYPQILLDQPDPRFLLRADTEGIQIYEIGGGQP
jgi:hypothetical protein